MYLKNGSRFRGTRLAAIGVFAAGALATGTASADTIFTVNGVDVDSAVVDLYFNSRLGGQGGQATPEQRIALIAELKDIFVLATQPGAAKYAQDAGIVAQLELQEKSILAQAVAAEYFENIEVTEVEIAAEYDLKLTQESPLEFKAKHILVETQGEAMEIIAQLDDGANFEELAKEKSTGPSGPNGGDLGWFSPNQMVQPFSAAVQGMEDGAYSSQPVQTQFGWHVILREESRESIPPPLESVTEEMKASVQQRKFQDHLAKLREAAEE
jgi:peptidyl-prolyl cis-trans isomerase C